MCMCCVNEVYRLGLGAPVPDINAPAWSRSDCAGVDEKLRKQLLGKNAKRGSAPKQGLDRLAQRHAGKERDRDRDRDGDDEEDGDEGRVALVGRKSERKDESGSGSGSGSGTRGNRNENEEMDDLENGTEGRRRDSSSTKEKGRGKKKAASFLDEVLAERAKKRKKR